MRERVRINKSNNNSSTSVQNSFHTRPSVAQRSQNTNGVPTQEDIENQQYQQDRFEATKLEIQAKYGTITPEGQERLVVLQAKKAQFWQKYLGKTRLFSKDFSQIPLHSTDVSSRQAIQTKLTIGSPGDKYEQEADRVAAQVVNHINSPVSQPSNQNFQREELPVIQTRPWLRLQALNEGMAAPAELESSIQQARSGGQPLADNIRKPMERAFGADFSRVKVHTDVQADQLNQSVQAKAFTTGQDVFFRQGEYQPGSHGGQELLAHELTHVVQQNGGAVQRSTLTLQMVPEKTKKEGVFCDKAYPTLVFTLDNEQTEYMGENVYSVTGEGLQNPTQVMNEGGNLYYDLNNNEWVPQMAGETVTVTPALKYKLSSIAKKYGGKKGERCHECATEMQDAFEDAEIKSEVYEIAASDNSHIMVMEARVRNHYVNVVDNRAYDASTGGEGKLWEDYFKDLKDVNRELELKFWKVG